MLLAPLGVTAISLRESTALTSLTTVNGKSASLSKET